MNKKNVLFLYTEIAGYTITCMKHVMELNPNLQIHIVRWAPASDAPFVFDFGSIKVYERSDFDSKSLIELVSQQNIETLLCSGWVDKEYVKVCRFFKGKIPTVLVIDNPWKATVKQRIAQVLSSFLIKRNFTHAWVPGNGQFHFVRRLGISEDRIRKGFYVADTELFEGYYKKSKELKERKFPKRFLYVGRYLTLKGVTDLWQAFLKLHKEVDTDWELWCVGAGEEYDRRENHPKLKHFGFLQSSEFLKVIEGTGVYILPSHSDHWGVAVQEFSAAGYPLILSDKIGAKESFLVEGENGYSFEATNIDELVNAMKKIISLSEKELIDMQLKSIELSLSVTTQEWNDSLMSFKL